MSNYRINKPIKSNRVSPLEKFLDFDIAIKKKEFPKLIPMILFLAALAVIYIAKNIYSSKTLIEMEKMKVEIKDMRAEYLKSEAEYMNMTKLSEVSDVAKQMGLKELSDPQKKIIIKDGE